jgi:hypothetical protein
MAIASLLSGSEFVGPEQSGDHVDGDGHAGCAIEEQDEHRSGPLEQNGVADEQQQHA